MKVKKVLLASIIASQILSTAALAAPDEAIKEFNKVAPIKQEVKHFQGEVKLFIIKDGEKVRVDQKMTDGLRVVGGRTCVGVRDLVNAIEGADVEWDGTNHIVDITYAGKTISYPVGKPLMWADGKAVTIDVPAQIDPAISKTFLPIRNIAETLGFKVDWDNKAKEVVLTPGAGKGVTTAQQPRPTTQTPTQNSKTKITLASGQTVDINKKPTARPEVELVGGAKLYEDTYNLNDSDFIDIGDSLLFGKGTSLELELPKRLRRVTKSDNNPDFKILGKNVNDNRIGTYVIGEGEESWEECRNYSIKKTGADYMLEQDRYTDMKLGKESPDLSRYIDYKDNKERILSLLKDRKISSKNVDEFYKHKKFINGSNNFTDSLIPVVKDNFYDGTGLFDNNIYRIGPNFINGDSLFGYMAYYVTENGEYFLPVLPDCYNNQNITIDKVIYSADIDGKIYYIVIDIPNFTMHPMQSKNGYELSNKALTIFEKNI